MADVWLGLRLRAARFVDRALWDLAPAARAATDRGAFAVGAIVDGRYELQAVLGEGAFGRVWRARSIEENRLVALKELRGREEQTREQFESEFFLLSRLKHPNIVRVFDYGEAPDGTRYLVMELVPGRDLTDFTKRGPLGREQATHVIAGLLQALQLLHARLLVHCDIKADNIRLTTKGDVKLMDFGLLHQLGTPALSISGTVVTMSPEMMQGGVIDGRSDLYSVGCLAYELFTGELPFKGESIAEVMQRVQHETPKPPSYFLDVPAEIDRFVLTLLSKAPDARFADAGAALRGLQAATGIKVAEEGGLHKTSYLFSPELVGRDAERAQLEAARAGAAEGHGGAVFVSGKSGEGKSRLLEDLRVQVKLARMQWCAAQCRSGSTTPLLPLSQALSAIADRAPDSVIGEHGAALATLLPSIASRLPASAQAAPVDPSEKKARLLAGVVALVRAIATRSPVVLVLEDLHVADVGTLEVLNHVIRSCGSDAVLVLGTFSSTELDRTSLAFATIHEGRAKLLELGPLPAAALPRLLDLTLVRHDLEPAIIHRLYEAAEGNALALFETLRTLIELGALAMDRENRWHLPVETALPHGAAEAFSQRFARFPSELAHTARALAVAGPVVDVHVTCDALGLDRPALQDRIEALIAAQVLKREGREVLFANESIRRAIYDGMDAADRRATHDRFGEALAKRQPVGDPATIAFHLRRGASSPRALPHLFEAASAFEKGQQPLEAIKLLQEATQVAKEDGGSSTRDALVRALDRMAGYTNLVPPVAAQAIEQLGSVWSAEVDWKAAAAEMRATRARAQSLPTFVRPIYRRLFDAPAAFTPSTRSPHALLNRWLQHRTWHAVALAILGNRDKALATADEAEAFLDAIDEPENLKDLLQVPRIICAVNMGLYEDALARVAAIRARLDDVWTPRTPEVNYARFWSLYGHTVAQALAGAPVDQAIQDQFLRWLDVWNVTSFRLFGFTAPVVRASMCGDPDAFDSQTTGFEALLYRLGFPEPATSRGRAVYPQYYARRGDFERARPVLQKLERIGAMDKWTACTAAAMNAVLAEEAGDPRTAAKAIDAGLALAHELGSSKMASLEAAKATVLLTEGARDEALAHARRGVEIATSPDRKNPADEAICRLTLARALGSDDGVVEARRALEVARNAQNKLHEGLALRAVAELARDEGSAREAAALADAAFAAIKNDHQRRRLAECMHARFAA